MSLGAMEVGDIAGALEGADDIMAELSGALDASCLGSLGAVDTATNSSAPVGVMKLVRDPAALVRAHKRAIKAERDAAGRARLARDKYNVETDPAARMILAEVHKLHLRVRKQHAVTARTIHILGTMRATEQANGAARANFAMGLAFTATGAGTALLPIATDTALIGPPITDRPWRMLAWQASALQAQNFSLLEFVPTTDDTVIYGNNGVTYVATTPTPQIPLHMWLVENYGAPLNPRYNFAPWESPRYVFGPSAVVKMRLGLIVTGPKDIVILGLGQCSPCNPPDAPLTSPTAFVDANSAGNHTYAGW